jgi:hypothetical protein
MKNKILVPAALVRSLGDWTSAYPRNVNAN